MLFQDRIKLVSGGLWRGPRPENYYHVAQLSTEFGIRRIINLQGYVIELVQVEYERQWAAQAGIEYKHHPWNLITPPKRPAIDLVVAELSDGVPTYFHCHDGVDRTGVACLGYRMKYGVSFGRAVGEMLDYGFHLSAYFWWLPKIANEMGVQHAPV